MSTKTTESGEISCLINVINRKKYDHYVLSIIAMALKVAQRTKLIKRLNLSMVQLLERCWTFY